MRRNRQRGMTLTELIVSLAVMAVVVSGATSLYSSVSLQRDIASLNQDLESIYESAR